EFPIHFLKIYSSFPRPTGWGGWINGLQAWAASECVEVPSYYTQYTHNHLVIVQGLAESYRLLQNMQLLNVYPWYRDNAPWNPLASLAWVKQVADEATSAGFSSAICERWGAPCSLTPLLPPDGSATGVHEFYEVCRSFACVRPC